MERREMLLKSSSTLRTWRREPREPSRKNEQIIYKSQKFQAGEGSDDEGISLRKQRMNATRKQINQRRSRTRANVGDKMEMSTIAARLPNIWLMCATILVNKPNRLIMMSSPTEKTE